MISDHIDGESIGLYNHLLSNKVVVHVDYCKNTDFDIILFYLFNISSLTQYNISYYAAFYRTM